MRRLTRSRVALATAVFVLVLAGAGAAWAGFVGLPPGGVQVNNDPGAGINPANSVGGEDPTNADVVGGSLSGGVGVPWAIFRQTESAGATDQIFVRSFAGGAWTTRGSGTVGGRSSASPPFAGSLNFDQTQDGEAPSIDFAGASRAVPWATWYEMTTGTGFANNNIFASRFDNTGDANQGKWIFGGQNRATSGASVPSLNINTNQDAENPSVAGGSAVDPTKPGPWVTWQETDTTMLGGTTDQIFTVRPEGPGMANCDGVTPAGVVVGSDVPAIGGFCWQQTGVPRVGAGAADPSLNVDPTRNGIEPDIAFTGANDSVPWVVWYETGTSAIGLNGNEMVFAAKGIADGVSANGGFHWVAVGNHLQGTLDTSGPTNGFGSCAESTTAEGQCSLNNSPIANAEDPQVAGGTMTPGTATVPWVAWDENVGGTQQIFVSRLVGGATGQFVIVGNGPITTGSNPATRPDITFSGNTPYVSWRQTAGDGSTQAFYGHFVNASNPTFVADNGPVSITPTSQADVREPTSSSCIATPFNGDGSTCQGGAIGTPFFLFTNDLTGTSTLGLFAQAYQPDPPVTGAASGVSTNSATVSALDNPEGAAVRVAFQFGTTTTYGQTTAAQTLGVGNVPASFASGLTGLPAATVIHYRAIVTTDFGSQVGADATLRTAAPPASTGPPKIVPPVPKITGLSESHKKFRVGSHQATDSAVKKKTPVGTTFTFTVNTAGRVRLVFKESVRGRRVSRRCVAKTKKNRRKHACTRTVTVGSISLADHAGLNRVHFEGLLPNGHKLKVGTYKMVLTATNAVGQTSGSQSISFKIVKH